MQRPVVLLPLPDSPTRPNISPSSIEKLTSSTALTIDGATEETVFPDEVLCQMPDVEQRHQRARFDAAARMPGTAASSWRVYSCDGVAQNLPHRSFFDDAARRA